MTITSSVAGHASGLTPPNPDTLVPNTPRTLAEASTDFNADATNPRGVYALASNGSFLSLSVLEVNRPSAEPAVTPSSRASGPGTGSAGLDAASSSAPSWTWATSRRSQKPRQCA